MAKSSGMGMGLYVSGVDVSGDIGSFGKISGGCATLDFTSIDRFAMERQGGIRSGEIDFTAFHNTAATRAHTQFAPLPTGDKILTGRIGSAIGSPAFSMVDKQLNYDGKRGTDAALIFELNAVSNGFGLEWGDLLTAGIRTDTGATTGPGYDTGNPIAVAFRMYVHLLAFTGTSVTIKLQASDDGTGDPYADIAGATTGALSSAPQAVRLTGTPGGFDQFVRVVTTGTFSNAQFVVQVVSDATTVVF